MISLVKQKKAEIILQAKDLILASKGFYVIDYKGWSVAEINSLRRKLKESGARMKVIKNTLFKIALKELNIDAFEKFEGTNAFVFVMGDEVQPLKIIVDFIKETNKGSLKFGYINGVKYNKEQLEELSKLPPINELRAKVLSSINAPIYKLVYNLKGLLSNLVIILDQIKSKKEA